jgi:hypothetical protein
VPNYESFCFVKLQGLITAARLIAEPSADRSLGKTSARASTFTSHGYSLTLSAKLKNAIVDQLPQQEQLRYLCQLQDPRTVRNAFLNRWKRINACVCFAVAALVAVWACNEIAAVFLAVVIASFYMGTRSLSASWRRTYLAAVTNDRLLLGSAQGLDGTQQSHLESIAWSSILSVHLNKKASTLEVWTRKDGNAVSMIISGNADDLDMLQLHMPAGVKRIH